MRVFFLEDVRKSYHFVCFIRKFPSTEAESDCFVFNPKIHNASSYLDDLRKALPDLHFIDYRDFRPEDYYEIDLFVNHTSYSELSLTFIKSLQVRKTFMFLGNNVGLVQHDKAALEVAADEYILWNMSFIRHLLESRESVLLKHVIHFREVDYIDNSSLIEHEPIETLIFAPTRMCFGKEYDITLFLKNMIDSLSNNEQKTVHFKAHQGSKDNYFESNKVVLRILTRFLSILPFNTLLRGAKRLRSNNKAIKFINYCLFMKIRIVFNFRKLSFPLIPIEFYLPLVQGKLIGGFSNTLITAAYLGRKIDLLGMKEIPESSFKHGINFDSANYLKLNMRFFYNRTDKNYTFSRGSFNSKTIKT